MRSLDYQIHRCPGRRSGDQACATGPDMPNQGQLSRLNRPEAV